jgi:hypothetical protein
MASLRATVFLVLVVGAGFASIARAPTSDILLALVLDAADAGFARIARAPTIDVFLVLVLDTVGAGFASITRAPTIYALLALATAMDSDCNGIYPIKTSTNVSDTSRSVILTVTSSSGRPLAKGKDGDPLS